jgi:protein phosphatase
VFIWPAFAFGVGAFGYAGFGAGIYRKVGGRLTAGTKTLLGPLLAAQWLSLLYYREKSARWNEVTPQVWIGALPTKTDAQAAIAAGVTAVPRSDCRVLRSGSLPPISLSSPARSRSHRTDVRTARRRPPTSSNAKARAGSSSSIAKRVTHAAPAQSAQWLLRTRRAKDVEMVVTQLEAVRPGIVIRPEIRDSLRRFGATSRD